MKVLSLDYYIREAEIKDVEAITRIYNQGIEDRVATLELSLKAADNMEKWLTERTPELKVIIIEGQDKVHGWASLNSYNSRCCYRGIADISIYIERTMRGRGLGKILLDELIKTAKRVGFHKLVLSMFKFNEGGFKLYKSMGFREVGTYEKQGLLDGKWVDVTIMERIL